MIKKENEIKKKTINPYQNTMIKNWDYIKLKKEWIQQNVTEIQGAAGNTNRKK